MLISAPLLPCWSLRVEGAAGAAGADAATQVCTLTERPGTLGARSVIFFEAEAQP